MKSDHFFSPKSAVDSIVWPALPSPHASNQLAMQYELNHTQWWDYETIRSRHLLQLDEIIHYARRHVPFYRKRLKRVFKAHTRINWDLWDKLPLLTRNDIQKSKEDLFSNKIPSQHGNAFKVSTSGSTGKPVTILQTDLTTFYWHVFTLREHLWHHRDFTKKLAIIRYVDHDQANPPNGQKFAGWGPSTDVVFKTSPSCGLSIKANIQQQASWLMKEKPHYLLTHPTNALALARFFQDSNETLDNLLEVRTLSETLTPETRKICKETWGVNVTDMYSCREVGYMALQCPEHEHYHVQSENVLVEILNDDNKPCAPGEIGRVVVTSLNNFASPIIRYDIGDYAEAGEPCSCGRGLPVIKRIMGRVRNMLTLPSGEQHWPVLNHKTLREILQFQQIQIVQHTLSEIEIRLVTSNPVSLDQEKQVRKTLQEIFNYPFNIRFSYPQEIVRSSGGKYEEFLSHIPD